MIKQKLKTIRIKRLMIFSFFGIVAGYAYYYFIGCNTNSCPITSDPFFSMGYGLAIGLVLGLDFKKTKNDG